MYNIDLEQATNVCNLKKKSLKYFDWGIIYELAKEKLLCSSTFSDIT